jgi:hypothetical protein
MKQLNVRLTADLYDAVQSLLQENLKMDLSTFVRELFIDALVIYGSRDRAIEVLAEMGQGHRIKQGPGLVLAMADRWRDEQAKTGAFTEKLTMLFRLLSSDGAVTDRDLLEAISRYMESDKGARTTPEVPQKETKPLRDAMERQQERKGKKA